MGHIMEDLIKVLNIEYSILPDYNEGAIELIEKATTYIRLAIALDKWKLLRSLLCIGSIKGAMNAEQKGGVGK